jgi:hypothetical protein
LPWFDSLCSLHTHSPFCPKGTLPTSEKAEAVKVQGMVIGSKRKKFASVLVDWYFSAKFFHLDGEGFSDIIYSLITQHPQFLFVQITRRPYALFVRIVQITQRTAIIDHLGRNIDIVKPRNIW